MSISKNDIKLMAPENLDDTEDGGGQMTGNEVVDGSINNLFPDMSHLDKMTGRVSMRKCFPAVLTDNDDTYYGMHVVLTDPPDDDDVSVCMMTTNSYDDKRTEARDRVEQYLAIGPRWPGLLYGTQYEGGRVVTLLQREEEQMPAIKSVLVLKDEATGDEQYVRVTELVSEVRTFSYNTGGGIMDYQRVVVSLTISDALRYTFEGSESSPTDTLETGSASVYDTVVTNSARYYGVVPLAQDIEAGDTNVLADSIYTQLVPAATTESAVTDLTAGGEVAPVLPAGIAADLVELGFNFYLQTGAKLYLGAMVSRSSLTITYSSYTWTDDGKGNLVRDGQQRGTVKYDTGEITFNEIFNVNGSNWTASYIPAAAPVYVADTHALPVQLQSQGSVWVSPALRPIPAPGTLSVDYMSQGKWYRLTDNGAGGLVGASAGFGAGSLNYTTGTATITTGALPDVGSQILFSWSGPLEVEQQIGALPAVTVALVAANQGLARNTVSVTWGASESTDDGLGAMSGDVPGTVNYATGEIKLEWPTNQALPAPGTEFTLSYDYGDPAVEALPAPDRNGNGTVTITLPNAPVLPGTVELTWPRTIPKGDAVDLRHPQHTTAAATVQVRDDGAGALIGVSGSTINYTTGVATFDPDKGVRVPVAKYGWV